MLIGFTLVGVFTLFFLVILPLENGDNLVNAKHSVYRLPNCRMTCVMMR